jgi:hypothetical protein
MDCRRPARLVRSDRHRHRNLGERRGYPTVVQASQAAQDAELARRLWAASSRLTGTGQSLPSAR